MRLGFGGASAASSTLGGGEALVRKGMPILAPAVAVLAVLLIWEIGVRITGTRAIILPTPSELTATIVDAWDLIVVNFWVTFYRTILAALLAMVGGSLLAVAITQSSLFARAVLPYILVSQVVPKIALAPLIIVWLGIGSQSRLTIAFLIAFFPMVIDVAAGLASVPEERIRLARMLRASEWQILRQLRMPSAIPYFFTGAKITVSVALIGILVSEFIAADQGLGWLIFDSTNRLKTPMAMAAAVAVTAMGLFLYGIVALAERLTVRWRECD